MTTPTIPTSEPYLSPIVAELQDFVLAKLKDKVELYKLTGVDEVSGGWNAVAEQRNLQPVVLAKEELIANLGKQPQNGKVYGVTINHYRSKTEVEGWGTVYRYRKMSKEEKRILRTAFTKVVTQVTNLGCTLHPLETWVEEAKGQSESKFKYRPKEVDGVSTDLVIVKPVDLEQIIPLLLHQAGLSLWWRRLQPEAWAQWILLYHSAVELQEVSSTEISQLIDAFASSNLKCKLFNKTLTERESHIFLHCLTYVKDRHLLSVKHLDTLIGSGHDLHPYFDVDAIKLLEQQQLLTIPALASPETFFAEAFALHLTGETVRKPIVQLLELTLATIKE